MHLVSVIVPVYKVEEYLRECVDSIISQTYRNLEIILVDDGSPDNCPAICDEYAEKDKRIIVIHQQNGGLSAARNAGLDIASGEFICFVDSDDVLHPQYCEILLTGIIRTQNLFCSCDVNFFAPPSCIDTYVSENISYSQNTLKYFAEHIETGVWNKIYKASIFDYIRFKEGRIHEDMFFWSDFFRIYSGNYCKVHAKLYFYRKRNDSIISKNKCHIDRVFAGATLYDTIRSTFPNLSTTYFEYAITYPWSFVDSIFVNFQLIEKRKFLSAIKAFLKNNRGEIQCAQNIKTITKKRMNLFRKSVFCYGICAYARLIFVYFCRLFHIDPYKSDRGI